MKLKLLVLAACVGVAVTGAAYAGDACCPKSKKAAAATEQAAPAVCKLCPKCGEMAGAEKCCKDAAKCDKCGLHQGAPGCCKLTDEQKKGTAAVELKCDMKACGDAKAGCPAKAVGGCPKGKAADKGTASDEKK